MKGQDPHPARGAPHADACIEKFDMGHVVPKPCLKKNHTYEKKILEHACGSWHFVLITFE